MAKNETAITAEAHAEAVAAAFDRGVRIAHGRIISAIDNEIIICRSGDNVLSDALLRLKGKLPTVDKIIADARG